MGNDVSGIGLFPVYKFINVAVEAGKKMWGGK
jgi:hypothetical protein